jgi:hypothetical protein
MFQLLRTSLLALTTDTDVVHFACDGCNRISAYSKTDLPVPRTLDSLEGVERLVVIQRVFAIDIGCEDTSCKSPIRIYEPTGGHYDTGWVRLYLEKSGSPDSSVACPKGHPAAYPVRVVAIREV